MHSTIIVKVPLKTMEFTREIYWNIGHSAGVRISMYVLSVLGLGILLWGFLRRIRVYRLGQPLNRTDNLRARVLHMLCAVMGQTKVLTVKGPGIVHGCLFWAFFLLFLGTCLILVQADFTDLLFGVKFLDGAFYLAFSLVLDVAGAVAIVMLAGLFARRYFMPPKGLESKVGDAIMHGTLFVILISGFVVEGARMAVTELGTPLASWSPVGLLFANGLNRQDVASLRSLHVAAWWFHLLAVIVFISMIPFTKFRHIFATSANYLFADRRPKGMLVTIDLEDEGKETFGAAMIADLTWKDLFDADACTLCQRCQERCPAHVTDKPLSPMKIISQIGEVAFTNPQANLIEICTKDALWSCTTCRACQEICPASIEHVGKIVEMRREIVLMEGEFPGDEVMAAMEQTEVNGNPLGMGFSSRGDWAENLGIQPLSEEAEVDVLFFVGCYASFDKRNIEVAKSFVTLCRAAGIKVGILGKEEKCCGEPMRKLGNEYLYQAMATENIKRIKAYDPPEIVTACPHCFNTLNKDYRDLGFDGKVTHYTVFLEKLVKTGNLVVKPQHFNCTYHDSCYLGRYNDLYHAPRALLQYAGGIITEMSMNRGNSFCCGGGGGRILAEEKLGERINVKRTKMAIASGAPTLISNCPFCLTMFEDGIKGAGVEAKLNVRDIAEVLAERLE